MIPVIPKVDLNEAKYTTLLNDISDESKTTLETLLDAFGTDEMLTAIFYAKYRYYEICDKDESIFLQCVNDVYDEHKKYYLELLENYNKEYDYATGNKRIVSRDDSAVASHNKDVSGKSESTSKEYDLPNKTVDPNDEFGYLTGADKNENENQVSDVGSSTSDSHSDVTTIYADEFLDLKRKYLAQIRNVYSEFADKFKDCFLHIY